MGVGLKIRDIRKVLKLSQKEFANEIGTSRSNLSQIEIGKTMPTFHLLKALVGRFNMDANLLFADIGINRNSISEQPAGSASSLDAEKIEALQREIHDKEEIIQLLREAKKRLEVENEQLKIDLFGGQKERAAG